MRSVTWVVVFFALAGLLTTAAPPEREHEGSRHT